MVLFFRVVSCTVPQILGQNEFYTSITIIHFEIKKKFPKNNALVDENHMQMDYLLLVV